MSLQERGVGVSIEGVGGTLIRVGEIPDLADAIENWINAGDNIDERPAAVSS